MSDSHGALCSDFYVNQRLNLKMDLPADRETVLGMFDRVRRDFPAMDRFRRFPSELVLESDPGAGHQQWISMRKSHIRTGVVNGPSPQESYALHKLMLETAPYYLSISSLDIDYLELLYGFDLLAAGNHDLIVHEALFVSSPLGRMLDIQGTRPLDCQPVFGIALDDGAELQAFFEVKTRTPGGPGSPTWRSNGRTEASGETNPDAPQEPISVYLTLRRYGSFRDVSVLKGVFDNLSQIGEKYIDERVVPNLLLPIREAIASHNA
jgi:hypothetical protein